ncbi:class I SAM-dependent methyltransferase [Porphyrobacter sp. ULC335]|uniref:class I SAM-dependent methyltransferase n=1 Tax=Porphyrobacter sp. ULC335 TaxID=2854260 RepID=UPI0022211A21|nr:class I SAM-dependent methyltransferase [Porphyrobacter sp. ULC335]UYV15392.1 class I SAM-dependent methyltransferase [Porphyrobacter sp. ULC335]
MELAAYQSLRASQDRHWWFVGRRRIVAQLISMFVPLPANARVLEAGCGYGGNLAMLDKLGEVQAFEFNDDARAHAANLLRRPVAYGRLPDKIGFDNDRFDLIAMLDVLEHIDDDVASLRTLGERLAPGGALLLTVPAVPWLWSDHDVLHQHKRRYTRALLAERLHAAGFEIAGIGYFNTLLFPLALAQRLIARLVGAGGVDHAVPPEPLNALMTGIFSLEVGLLGRIPFPIGLSLFAVARKRRA